MAYYGATPLATGIGGTGQSTFTNGQLLIGVTAGGTLAKSTLTAGAGISIANGAGTITITNTAATSTAYTPVVFGLSPYTVLATDVYIGADVTGGPITLLLPNAPAAGRVFYVKDVKGLSATSAVTITTVGGVVLIDAAATYLLNSPYEAVSLIFNGSSYEIY